MAERPVFGPRLPFVSFALIALLFAAICKILPDRPDKQRSQIQSATL